MLYTKSAAQRILNRNDIKSVEEWFSVVFVTFRTGRPTFVSKKAFKADFVEFRKAGSSRVNVKNHGNGNWVAFGKSGVYNLTVNYSIPSVTCNCLDHQAIRETLGNGVCKHGYAVLTALGVPIQLGLRGLAEQVKSIRDGTNKTFERLTRY